MLRALILSLDDETKEVLERNIEAVLDKGRGLDAAEPSGNNAVDSVRIPFGPGEMDEPLGIPLCVVCQNADKIEALEKDQGWKGEELDFIQQYLRTILLKHGASLVYTMASAPGPLQNLIHSHLGIRSLVKQEEVNPQATQEYRDKILIPPYWDAWSRIRLAGNGLFDFEGISAKWSSDIEIPPHVQAAANGESAVTGPTPNGAETEQSSEELSATQIYEDTIKNPGEHSSITALLSKQTNGIEVASKDTQDFLAEQLLCLEALRREDENDQKLKAARKIEDHGFRGYADDASGVVEEHIGPVQFNMGGIQVNADEMVKRLQVGFRLYSDNKDHHADHYRIAKRSALNRLKRQQARLPTHRTRKWTMRSWLPSLRD
jgi:dynein light intermediate chain 1